MQLGQARLRYGHALRAEVESLGLDISYHGGSSYPHDRGHTSGYEVPIGGQVGCFSGRR